MDLSEIPGFCELQTKTKGDSRIIIAVLDGSVDLERTCFLGANLRQIKPYWSEEVPIDPRYLDIFREINQLDDFDDGTKEEKLKEAIPDKQVRFRLFCNFHATHISSTIFGQPNSPVEGIAQNCRGINIPIETDGDNLINPLYLTHAFNKAIELGANIIHCAACHPTNSGMAHELLEKAVRQAQDNNILVVAPGGNNKGECWCIPAVLENVLSVGAYKDNGKPAKFSNFGGRYQTQGILAPGENILGAQPGIDEPVRKRGTSCAAPIVTGVAALLMSWQLKQGCAPDAEAVRAALINSAIPCDPEEIEEPERCLRGKLNIPGAFQLLTGKPLSAFVLSSTSDSESEHRFIGKEAAEHSMNSLFQQTLTVSQEVHIPADSQVAASAAIATIAPSLPATATMPNSPATAISGSDGITASLPSNLVYALGTLGYDFGSEARRDTFKQLMPAVSIDGVTVPANPYDARQMADYLEQNPSEAKALIWTLNLELTPVYAIEPKGAFGAEVYETLIQLLAGQVVAEDSEDYIERVSIPGRFGGRTVELFSGQVVPVIEPQVTRGMYGWRVNSLVSAALETFRDGADNASEEAIRRSLASFLHRIYFDLRNLGQTAHDRALNFAATNAFQAASTFAEAVARGMELDSIEVEKSPFCRLNSDCWDVKLKFFDAENSDRAKKVFRFTIDVRDAMPVTLGEVRSWSVPK
ncbi:MAG: PatA/PatG family cyanobactin maturation protease [Oscillatoriales cyanobacterium]|nr:MAG: PatA/PatG family cyanobactin maturation protease [Oscillatoriales cyanobacterium]TAH20348.1 MAG: PatA/PatG family cyanobactin maturation protease [Oscillatoriales cyanobacterium]